MKNLNYPDQRQAHAKLGAPGPTDRLLSTGLRLDDTSMAQRHVVHAEAKHLKEFHPTYKLPDISIPRETHSSILPARSETYRLDKSSRETICLLLLHTQTATYPHTHSQSERLLKRGARASLQRTTQWILITLPSHTNQTKTEFIEAEPRSPTLTSQESEVRRQTQRRGRKETQTPAHSHAHLARPPGRLQSRGPGDS